MADTDNNGEPITVEQATRYLLLDGDVAADDRELIASLITTSRLYCEGYCDREFSTDPPEDVIAAMRLLIGHWYENRSDVLTGVTVAQIPIGAHALLNRYRRVGL